MQSIKLREYLPRDRSACIEAFLSNIPKYFMDYELELFTTWLDKKVNEEGQFYYVVELEDQIIGCGGYFVDIRINTASLTWGLIHHKFHNKGYGKQLTQFRIDKLKGYQKNILLELNTTQYACDFFKKFGFSILKYTPEGYGKGMDKYDMLLVI